MSCVRDLHGHDGTLAQFEHEPPQPPTHSRLHVPEHVAELQPATPLAMHCTQSEEAPLPLIRFREQASWPLHTTRHG